MTKTFCLSVLLIFTIINGWIPWALSQPQAGKPKVAILIYEGVQIIDYTGPYEVFGQRGLHDVYTVAEKPNLIVTEMGMRVTPAYDFENHPKADVLVIPGGRVRGQINNPRVINWIKDNAKQAEYVLSVCNGAFLLAKAGLLEKLEATTFYALIDSLETFAPNTKVRSDKRFVDNGKVITTAGISSGIDGALHVISKIHGTGWAQAVALNMEYNWQPDSDYARAAFADKYLWDSARELLSMKAKPLRVEGDRDHWQNEWLVQTNLSAGELLTRINDVFETKSQWAKRDVGNSKSIVESFWTFIDEKNENWKGTARVEHVREKKDELIVTTEIERLE